MTTTTTVSLAEIFQHQQDRLTAELEELAWRRAKRMSRIKQLLGELSRLQDEEQQSIAG